MVDQNKSIETLKTQVDQVGTDIESLKTETSEELKKAKAEIIEKNALTAKQEIAQKLETLKGLTDEKSKTDTAKLEEMLKTLETTKVLKGEVTKPREVPKNKETVDNTTDLQSIGTGLETIKNLVKELQTNIDTYKSQKDKMNATDKATKEKEIEEKKIAIEVKRKEIQTIIDKIKKGRKEIKIDDISDENIRKILIDQKTKEEALLTKYETELTSIKNPASTFMETLKDGANKAWENVKERTNKMRERGKENPGKAIAATAGIGLLVRGISKLFKRNKKEKSEKDGEKKEKKPRYKKWWGILGIGTGGILAWKNRDKIKDFFSGLFGGGDKPKEGDGKTDDIDNSAKEFKEKLTEEEKKQYNTFADQVNGFYTGGNGEMNGELANDQLGKSDFETYEGEKIQGLIPFMLNNRYKKVDSLLSESTFYKEVLGTESDIIIKKIEGRTANEIGDFLMPMAKSIDGMVPALLNLKTTGKVDDFVKWLKGNPNAQENIRMAFRKSMMVISYLNSKENNLKQKLVADYLTQQDSSFVKKTIEDQNEMIAEKLQDKEFCKKNIDAVINTFHEGSLYEGIKILQKYGCLDDKLDSLTQEAVDKVDERKKDLLDQDKDGNNRITIIKDEFENGKLNKNGISEVNKLINDFEEEIDDAGSISWYNKYIPIMNFFDPSDDIMQKIIATGNYEKIVKTFKDKISELREKSKKGMLTPSDIDDFKKTIDEYYDFQRSIVKSQVNIEEVFDKNGNKIIRWGNMTVLSGESLWNGGEMMIEKKYLEGGLVVAGALVSLDIATYPIRLGIGLTKGKIASSPSLKVIYKIGKFTLKQGMRLTGKSLNMTMRNYMPNRVSAMMYKGKDYIFRYEIAKGNISLGKAVDIAKRNEIRGRISSNIISTDDELIQRMTGIGNSSDDMKHVDLIKKYWNNKNILKQVINSDYKGKWYTMTGRAEKVAYSINPGALKELGEIDSFLGCCTHAGKSSLIKGFLETTKDLKPEMIQEIFATQTFDAMTVEQSGKIGKLLGKHMDKFSSLDDFKKFQGFFARNFSRYPSETFVSNALSKRSKLSTLDDVAQAKYIESAQLNISRYEKIASKVKTGTTSMIKDLGEMLKNPKLKTFYTGIKSKITNLTEYVKTVTPESIKAIGDTNRLDKITGFGKLTDQGVAALKSLNVLIKTDATILKSLSAANKIDDVKSILRSAGIAVENIDNSVLMQIVQTKNISKIESIINYGAEIRAIGVIKKIFTNPGMKVFAKWLGVVGAVADFAFVGMDFVSDMAEAEKIKQTNLARGQNKESEAYFDVVVGSTGAMAGMVGAIALFGAGNVWNPVGRVCLAGAGTAMGVEALGDLYYGEIDKFKQNYKDFLAQSEPEIKQRLIAINSWQTGLDSSFQDLWSNVTGNMGVEEKKNLAPKTSADAVKALIYLEEMQKYPYASADLNAPEVRNNPNLKSLVEEQKKLHDKAVEVRYTYIFKNYIDKKTSIVSKDAIEKHHGIASLDTILAESRICQAVDGDSTYTTKTDIKGYPKYLETELKKNNADGFVKLEKMYGSNKVHFFQIIASIPYYESMLNQYPGENHDILVDNLAYFKKYINYKLLNMAVSDYPTVHVDENKIDYDEINNLLSSWKLTTTGLTATEVTSKNIEYLTDAQLNEKYNISNNLGQNILYEIANKQLKYVGKNNLADLKTFYTKDQKSKDVKGIYFDAGGDNDWAINENNGSDNEFATDAELNNKDTIIKMRSYIYDAGNSATTGNMIAGNDEANKEFSNNYIEIIDQNLDCRINPTKYHKQIIDYIKLNSNGKYIQLPADLLIMGAKSGIANIGAFVYSRDGKKIDTKTTLTGVKLGLI